MTKTLRIVLALCAFFALSFTIAACGGDDDNNDVPSNAVASVDGTPVTRADYDRWVEITAKSSSQGADPVIPDPPSYTRCVAALTRQARAVRGQRVPAESALRAQCRQIETQLRNQTMQSLIQTIWLEREAADLGITVTDRELERTFNEAMRQSFPRRGDYEKFLRTTGMTRDDVLEQLRSREYATRITDKVQRDAGNVTEAQVSTYYDRNREQFAVPERRDLEIVLTRTEANAEAAKRAIEGGDRWADVARRYSSDTLSKSNGGRLLGVARGQQDRALDTAAFAARRGVVVGPVRGQFGWYIVRVDGVTPARQNTLAESRDQIRELLRQQNGQRALTEFGRRFERRWVALTNCRREFIVPQICGNAPRTGTTATSGGTVATSTSGD
ncbi:peptidyl-prolyl cis-trans isomerase [Conexibacter sp. JD483]|uniref:peptidyl-prolyl cis-trans isomerase n=1 Tax=unclassified Conexibacter TaxID=2627773 RepID=UPI00271BB599|nr:MULTISPECIES: peptidyl-prolyl cis-trans isomerase [unclassified Conexibacter]MDO8185935.1 peptidyl-prolyl cis-trans isomerase [Conexibacter sp. CPCC 205706]MDO8199426.1 peptidyl-prolyl cis-trans isomerase [Conexibacter sp. CPCC 205762]MDR9368545.1 peptidyl-prolyl cis-trans isomerase [Conexibacter sp. JD483]